MIFKTLNGDLTVFNKTLISTKDHLKSLQSINTTVYNKNGAFNLQGLLVNSSQSVSTFTKLNNAFKAYNGNLSKSTQLQNAYVQAVGKQNVTLGNYLAGLNGAKASMGGYVKSLVAAKAASIGLQAASIALNTAISMGITFAISGLISQISKWIHAQEEAREKSTELTSQWKEENSSIDDSISKYKELKEKLDDTSLSASEIKGIKEELLGVQDDLVEKYGNEALKIDLVNGKYDEQIAKLEKLSKLKAQEYVAANYSNVQEDIKYVTEKINLNKSLGFKAPKSDPEDFSEAGFDLQKYLDRYETLDAKVNNVDGDGQYSAKDVVNLITNGTREQVYDQIVQLSSDLLNDFGTSNEQVNQFREKLSSILENDFDTTAIEDAKNNIKAYAESEIMSQNDTRKLYADAIDAVEEYNEALQSGKGIDAAKANLESVQQSVKNATSDIEGAEDVFDDIYSGINKTAENKYKVDQAFENNKEVQSYAEALRGLSEDDLQKIDFEDSVLSPGEEAFSALVKIIGLSEDEIQALINKLIELGIVQGNISDEISDKNPISLGYVSLLTNKFESIKSKTITFLEMCSI